MVGLVHQWQLDVLLDFGIGLLDFVVEDFCVGHAILDDEDDGHIHDNDGPVLEALNLQAYHVQQLAIFVEHPARDCHSEPEADDP